MPSKAISYIRFSSSIQKRGTSLKRQTDMINAWLVNNQDVSLSKLEYKDLGRSGYHGTHLKHQFGDLLDAIEDGLISSGDYILVEAIDRIGRLPTLSALNIITGICMKGVKIITLEDGNEYSEESIAANAGIIYYLIGKIDMAHNYSKNLSRRVESAWDTKRQNAEDGKGVNRKSFWYITQDEDGKYNTITPQDKALVNKIFTMILSGVSLNKTIAFLRENDPIRFEKVAPSGLKKLLTNKTAIGYWGDMPNVYEPVVEESLFYSVKNLIESRKKGQKQGGASNHIMAGLVGCKRCGKNYSMRNQKHSATVMYCTSSNKGDCTNTATLPLAVLNEFRMRTQNSYIRKVLDAKVDNDNQKFIVALDGKIDTVSKSIENFIDLVASGSKSASKRVIKLEDELEELTLERAGLFASESTTVNIENLKMAGLDMSKDPLILNGMLKQVGYKIQVDDKTITLDTDHMEYIKYVKSGAATGSYEVSCHGVIEHIYKLPDDRLSADEHIYQLITK
jgi:DNA invertase Pin-like site-specific DNA recombinase